MFIPDPTKSTKEEGEKLRCLIFFVATYFNRIENILFLNRYRKNI